jgi:PPOX class probable F420-dependent enzyme
MDDEVRELFGGGNFAHLATLLPDGSPHSVPLWTIVEDGRIAFFTQAQSRKARNLARDPRVALSVVDRANPYRRAWARGRAAQTLEGDERSRRSTGSPTPTSVCRSRCAAARSTWLTSRARTRRRCRSSRPRRAVS